MRLYTYIGLLSLVLPILATPIPPTPIPNTGNISIPDGSLGTRELHTRDFARVTLTLKSQAGEEMQQLTAEKIKHIFQRTKADAYTSVDNGDGSWTVTFKGGKTSMEAAMYYVSIDKVKWKQTINFKEELD